MEREELLEALEGFKQNVLDEVRAIVPKQKEGEKGGVSQTSVEQTIPGLKGKDADLVAQIVQALEARNKTNAQQVYDTMFDERVSSLTSQYPAFGEYLASQDDFGEVILDRIKKIEDYTKRVAAFDKVFKNFASAQSSDGQDMRLSKAVKKQVEDDTTQRDAIKEKFLKGEMGLDEFTHQYFGTVESQIERLKKGK